MKLPNNEDEWLDVCLWVCSVTAALIILAIFAMLLIQLPWVTISIVMYFTLVFFAVIYVRGKRNNAN